MGSFADSIRKNVERVKVEIDTKIYGVFSDLSTRIVWYTPSKSGPTHGPHAIGLLSNQWYPVQGYNFSTAVNDLTNPSGAESITRIEALAGAKEWFGKDGSMTLTNNISYGEQAEYGGWPRTVPYAMVRTAFAEITDKYRG